MFKQNFHGNLAAELFFPGNQKNHGSVAGTVWESFLQGSFNEELEQAVLVVYYMTVRQCEI